MEPEHDRLNKYLTQAAARFGVTIEGAAVSGRYNSTAGVRTSGPALAPGRHIEPRVGQGRDVGRHRCRDR